MRNSRLSSALGILFFLLLVFHLLKSQGAFDPSWEVRHPPSPVPVQLSKKYENVLGSPTARFRDNLVPGKKYMTAWTAGGLTNAFIAHANLIYIALLAGRIPVLPPFTPVHVDKEPGIIQVGDVFNLDKLSEAIRIPVVEWSDIKDFKAGEIDDLGCWSAQETLAGHFHLSPQVEKALGLNFSFTRVPEYTRLTPSTKEYWGNYMALASLSFPSVRTAALEEAKSKPKTERPYLPPDEQMMCFDLLYYTSSSVQFEWEREWAPAWRFVGVHLRWTENIERIVMNLVARAFGYQDAQESPKFIAVHVRRTDFKQNCQNSPHKNCLPPLAAYARKVKQVQEEIEATHNFVVDNVLVTSDESEDDWWTEVKAMGWARIDHVAEKSEEVHGKWLVPVLDVVAQSLGTGFVGTDHSTMSLVSGKRVADWHGGVVKMVKWDPFNPDVALET